MFTQECEICGAPGGEIVIRRVADHLVWSLDLSITRAPLWTAPHRVRIVQKSGLCETCHLAKRANHERKG